MEDGGVQRLSLVGGGLLLFVATTACGHSHVDTYGIVTTASASHVCFRVAGGKSQCVDDPALIARAGSLPVIGACVRLRLFPETSGSATLSTVESDRCRK
jgi:hypothetical protein